MLIFSYFNVHNFVIIIPVHNVLVEKYLQMLITDTCIARIMTHPV